MPLLERSACLKHDKGNGFSASPLWNILGVSYFEGGAGCVAGIGQDLYGFFEHDPESVGGSIATKSCIILPQSLLFLILNNL